MLTSELPDQHTGKIINIGYPNEVITSLGLACKCALELRVFFIFQRDH